MINSKQKGKRGELELAKAINEHGYETRRSVQYNGQAGQADLVGLPGVHIECKRAERVQIADWMEQAVNDSKGSEIPAVFHRKNGQEWFVTIRLTDFMRIYKAAESFFKNLL